MAEKTETQVNPEDDIFGMPDDEVMNMASAPAAGAATTTTTETKTPEQLEAERVEAERVAAEQAEADRVAAEAKVAEAGKEGTAVVTPPGSAEGKQVEETAEAKAAREAAEAEAAKKQTPPAKEGTATPAAEKKDPPAQTEAVAKAYGDWSPEEKASALDKLMKFKANGRDIELTSPEEALKLQQMGANYTKKMQALQPALRVVRMLENNKLLDETQLSYLIDLHQRKPEAIQKLLADSKFDPMSADADKAAGYVPGDHRVSDAEMNFEAVLDEIQSTTTGQELITEVAQQWDAGSKQALFRDPQLMVEINRQKANGLYARISDEVKRRQVLGELQGVPFLAAYNQVGQDLQAKGLLKPKQPETAKQPVETRVAAPAAKVVNNEQAKAASSTKVTPATAKTEVNFLDVPDDEFLKQMNGRV